MKLTKYEYMKYVLVFANVFTAILVYFLLQRMAERQLIDSGLALPITFFAVVFTALMSYLIFRFSPTTKRMKDMEVGDKTIAVTVVEFVVFLAILYALFNAGLIDAYIDFVFL